MRYSTIFCTIIILICTHFPIPRLHTYTINYLLTNLSLTTQQTTTIQKTITGKTITVSGDAEDDELQRVWELITQSTYQHMLLICTFKSIHFDNPFRERLLYTYRPHFESVVAKILFDILS